MNNYANELENLEEWRNSLKTQAIKTGIRTTEKFEYY